jgi:hypothetical protein
MNPFNELARYAQRYDRLKVAFTEFHKIALTMPTHGDAKPALLSAMTVGELHNPGYFDTSIGGTTTRIQFKFLPGSPSGSDGVATAYVVDPVTGVVGPQVGAFQFSANGDTSEKFTNGDSVTLTDTVGAFHVVGRLVHAAVYRKE